MKTRMKALAVLAATVLALGVLAGCGSDQKPSEGDTTTPPKESTEAKVPTTADYAGTYLFESMTTTADGKTTEMAVGDDLGDGTTVTHGFAVSTLNADGTCTLEMSATPGKPMEGTWTVKSAGVLEITTGDQVAEAIIEGDTLTTPSTFDAEGKTIEMSFVFKKASDMTRADYAGTYHIQKIVVDRNGTTEEYKLGDEYQGTTLTEDSEISLLNMDGTCSLKSDINEMEIPDGIWFIVEDDVIEIAIAGYPEIESETNSGAAKITIENGTMTQTFKTSDNESTTFTYLKK